MTAQQLQIVDLILRTGVSVVGNDPLALLQEGFVKVGILRALLDQGYRVREGCSRAKMDWLLTKRDGVMDARLVRRSGSGKVKPDIRVEAPTQLRIELKVYGEVGSKDTFNRTQIQNLTGSGRNNCSLLWDLECVRSNKGDVAIVISSARNYDTARGQRWGNRGMEAALNLDQLLPDRRHLRLNEITEHQGIHTGVLWCVRALLAVAPEIDEYDFQPELRRKPEERVVMALWPGPA